MAKPKESNELHFVGVKGVAMSGMAVMAQKLGYIVTGSDVAEVFPTDELLHKNKIEVFEGFRAENLKGRHPTLIVSAAYGDSNPEVKEARRRRLRVRTQSELLGEFLRSYEGIGVSGVHGKTTTSSILAFLLKESGFSPSYVIGAPDVPGLQGNSHLGDGKFFVVEADEYRKSEADKTPKFLDLSLKHVIVTSIEFDHPDVFDSAESVYVEFYKLLTKVPRDGTIIACIDWQLVRRLVNRFVDRVCLTYGFDSGADFQIVDFTEDAVGISFALKTGEKKLGPFTSSLPGPYNAQNIAAAIVMALKLGATQKAIMKALPKFVGAKRRFERLGEVNGALVIDDYAHHPTAVTNVIAAAHHKFPDKKITIVFQPHTYSRTGKFLREFAKSLVGADRIILLDIWASAREETGSVTLNDLLSEIKENRPDVEFRSSLEEVAKYIKGTVSESDVVLLVGAGDVYKIFDYCQ